MLVDWDLAEDLLGCAGIFDELEVVQDLQGCWWEGLALLEKADLVGVFHCRKWLRC